MRGTLSRSQTLTILAAAVFLLLFSGTGMAQTCSDSSNCVTIMHTNDMHSKFVASPNADYSPGSTGDDSTIGGIARIATKVGEVRDEMDGLDDPGPPARRRGFLDGHALPPAAGGGRDGTDERPRV